MSDGTAKQPEPVTDRHVLGNMAAMREVLDRVHHYLGRLIRDDLVEDAPETSDMADDVWDVLNEPPRNCDVGTAEEQAERFRRFCDEHTDGGRNPNCGMCPLLPLRHRYENKEKCPFYWGQLPYEAPAAQKGGQE